ncbi:hypothetical protein NPX13_g2477 [Xylaria arbuscula]|uniref:Uncharacterized protein n=1 Tax=Xylaria arbuscula TaxID=114810 RepID=A0A9W8TR15_9PEZI|nr:hypothetical protein NPX13_g2477 [Xylaria arbuscula]
MQAPSMVYEAESTLIDCVDGVLVHDMAQYEPDFRSIDKIVSTSRARELWYIKFSDVTVSMALEFVKGQFGQEVVDSLRERLIGRSQRMFSYTQLLAMESTQKLAFLRTLGHVGSHHPSRSWLADLESFSGEVAQIAGTGIIYWNE